MYKSIIANTLRFFSDQSLNTPMVPIQSVQEKKDILVETDVKDTYISCYYPKGATENNLPVYINLHGGAFIMNSKEMDDPYCRQIANNTGCVVINVDYAKAPEYPFPGPLEQTYQLLHWIKDHAKDLKIDPEKIMVGGQSSGGNIMAALCLLLKERNEPQPLLQVLICPMLDFVTPHADKPEGDPGRARFPQAAHFLNLCYVPERNQAEHPLASPVLAPHTDKLAPAFIIAAEYDAFSLEAETYADKLRNAGVRVRHEVFEDCYHAFTHLGPEPKAQKAWTMIEDEIRKTIQS